LAASGPVATSGGCKRIHSVPLPELGRRGQLDLARAAVDSPWLRACAAVKNWTPTDRHGPTANIMF